MSGTRRPVLPEKGCTAQSRHDAMRDLKRLSPVDRHSGRCPLQPRGRGLRHDAQRAGIERVGSKGRSHTLVTVFAKYEIDV